MIMSRAKALTIPRNRICGFRFEVFWAGTDMVIGSM